MLGAISRVGCTSILVGGAYILQERHAVEQRTNDVFEQFDKRFEWFEIANALANRKGNMSIIVPDRVRMDKLATSDKNVLTVHFDGKEHPFNRMIHDYKTRQPYDRSLMAVYHGGMSMFRDIAEARKRAQDLPFRLGDVHVRNLDKFRGWMNRMWKRDCVRWHMCRAPDLVELAEAWELHAKPYKKSDPLPDLKSS
jgi:hypothetical protein